MADTAFTSSDTFLLEAAKAFFAGRYEATTIRVGKVIDNRLGWVPTFHFHANDHLIIAVEVSENPYPPIFKISHADLMSLSLPIAVYCVCPDEAFHKMDNQSDVRSLEAHGYGLITVDRQSGTDRRFSCIPIIQQIAEAEFKTEIEGLPKKMRDRLREAYGKYRLDPGAGVRDLSEVVEGLVLSAARAVVRKGWATSGVPKKTMADILDALLAAKECKNAVASIGGVRSFLKQYRNISSHYPRKKSDALRKYREAPHGFREGLKQIKAFREAMTDLGIQVAI